MLVRVFTSAVSWYWAEFVEVHDSDYLTVRCLAKQELHTVRKSLVDKGGQQ